MATRPDFENVAAAQAAIFERVGRLPEHLGDQPGADTEPMVPSPCRLVTKAVSLRYASCNETPALRCLRYVMF